MEDSQFEILKKITLAAELVTTLVTEYPPLKQSQEYVQAQGLVGPMCKKILVCEDVSADEADALLTQFAEVIRKGLVGEV